MANTEKPLLHLHNYRHLILYMLIGATGAGLDLVVFSLLVTYVPMLGYLVSNIISTILGITNNFLLNAFFNFKKTDNLLIRFQSFLVVGVLGIVVTSVVLLVCIEWLQIPAIIAKCFTIILVACMQYWLNKKFSFQ